MPNPATFGTVLSFSGYISKYVFIMDRLKKDWITEDLIDFEYKKYVLLAYLQQVERSFALVKLYPPLADLISHYQTAKALKENKQQLLASFPQRVAGFDPEQFRIIYERVIGDDQLMQEIESIVDFSLPRLAEYVNEGKKIFEFVEKETQFQPVGILPLDTSAGYLFLKDASAETRVYAYEITIFEQPDARYRGMHTYFVCDYASSLSHTFESIKTDLLRINRRLPNPAVFSAETGLTLPLEETFLPIAKRLLVRYVSIAA